MSLPNIFSQTPVEAALWTAAVGTQSEIANAVKSSPVFFGIVGLALGLSFIAFLFRLGTSFRSGYPIAKFGVFLLTVCLGISFLTHQNSSPFSPVNARGVEWKNVSKVSANPKYNDLQKGVKGLFWYTIIHRGLIEIGNFLTSAVARVVDDPVQKEAPQYLINALASTARVSIDDPEIERTFDELVSRCSDTKQGAILGPESSVGSLFDRTNSWCREKYDRLTVSLKGWAKRNRPTTLSLSEKTAPLLRAVGIETEEDFDNKVIASAVKNYARQKAGESYIYHSTNAEALVDGSDFWVNLSKAFSTGTLLAALNAGRDFLGMETRDYEGAVARNEAAVRYNDMLMFLPSARGFAKAIIAYLFVFASFALCIGLSGYFWGWLKMTALFTLYEPISSAFYYFTTKMISTTESIRAMDSLKVDPLVLAGADLIDNNLARMELVYFCIQIGLLFTFAFAGIKSFGALRNIKNSYLSDLFGSATQTVVNIAHLKRGFAR